MTDTTTRPRLAEAAVRDLVRDWYQALDRHDPVESVRPYLVREGLEMRFPEATLRSLAEFDGWYDTVTHRFFDEVHELTSVEVELSEDGSSALVKIVVNWQAKIWDAPEPRSKWLGFDAYQTWVVTADEAGRPLVRTYIVDDLAAMEGSASL